MHTKRIPDQDFLSKHPVLSAAGLLLVLRLVAWHNTALISRDSVIYITLAKDWASGNYLKALAHPYRPFYSFLIALFSKGFATSLEPTAVAISIIASVLTLPALEILFRNVKDKRIFFLGITFFCVSPYLTRYAADILTEPAYLFCISWSAAFLFLAAGKSEPVFFFLAGIFAGLAYLTRPEGLIVGISGGAWLLAYHKSVALKKLASSLLLLSAGTLLMASPYLLYLHWSSGQWLLTRKKRVETLIQEVTEKKRYTSPNHFKQAKKLFLSKKISHKRAEFLKNRRLWQNQQADKIRQDLGEPKVSKVAPGTPLWRWGLTLAISLGVILIGFLKGMFLPIGIWVFFRFLALKQYPWNRSDTFILFFTLLYWLILGLLLTGYGYVSRRHYAAVVMFWSIWAATGFVYACHYFSKLFKNPRLTPKYVGMVLLIPILSLSVIKGTKPFRIGKIGRKIVGRWILTRKGKGYPCKILTSMTRIGYYAGCRTIYLPTVKEKDVNALRRHEIGFIVLSKREAEKAPVLIHLLKKYHYHEVFHYISKVHHEDLRVFSFMHTRRNTSHDG